MIQTIKINSIVIPFLFWIVFFVAPFFYALSSEFYFYQAVLVGLIILPVLLIPLVRAPRRTLLSLLILTIVANPCLPLLRDYSLAFQPSFNFWLSDLILFFCWCYVLLKKLNCRSEYSEITERYSKALLLFFFCWIFFGLFTMLFAINKAVIVIELLKMARVLLIYLIIPFFIKNKSDLCFVVSLLVVAISLQALLILVQYITDEQIIRLPGGSRTLDVSNAGTLFRPSGTMGHSSNFAKLSALILPACFILQQFYQRHYIKKIFSFFLITIFIASVIVVSRIGLATSALGVSVALLLSLRTPMGKRHFLISLCVCFTALSIAWFSGGDRIVDRITYDNYSAASRIPQWLIALDVIKSYPLGVGLNNYTYVSSQFNYYNLGGLINFPVHNIYLLNFAELGLVGGSCFIGILVTTILQALKGYRKVNNDLDSALLLSIAIGLSCSWLQGMFGWGHRSAFMHMAYLAIIAGTITTYNYFVTKEG